MIKVGTRFLVTVALLAPFALAQAPRITKVDPPNCRIGLPEPMLLVFGEGLHDARFEVKGVAVALKRQQTSENGHYAFLWLVGRDSPPQSLQIIATNEAGTTKAHYELKIRLPATGRYRGFSSADVLYLIMTDRFAHGDPTNNQPGFDRTNPHGWHGGDLRGIQQHLDYVQSLGVTTIWTTPVDSNAGMPDSYHGYAAVDLYAIDPHFGTLADYRNLANAIHSSGMKIVFDIVPNHIGVMHPWIKDPPAPNWFHGTLTDHVGLK
jgi:hypothetical protein